MTVAQWIDAHTPTLSVVDSRGLAVRNVGYHCHPLNPAFESRINRNQFDPAGRLVASWDPRLWGMTPKPILASTFGLQGRPLLVDSVDAGWQLSLLDQADVTRSYWDGRGSQRHSEYDELVRPINVIEQMAGEVARVSDRFIYGTGSEEFVAGNQCGQLIRHKHPAGSRSLCEYGVDGLLLLEQTRFMHDLEPPDWSSEWADTHLEDEVFETSQRYGPSGDMRSQSDAMGNVRSFTYDQAGQLRDLRLKLAAPAEESRLLVSDIHYDALGRSLSERAGNGVITTARYADDDGRLLQLKSDDVDGEALQDFNYGYDPVGNITHIEDSAQRTRYFNNQRIDPVCRYGYDSLYQLIEASGSEVSQPSHGPALPTWQTTPLDPNQLRNYTQSFEYDAAGNLQTRHHSGAETFEMFTALDSNCSVANKENLDDGFDANGNQLELLRGQKMSWDIRNQLSLVTLVIRDDDPDDTECYGYDSPGHRLRKVRLTQAASRTLRAEVRYLPGVEIHRDATTGEERHVINVEAGRSQVRALHWAAKLPGDVRNDQLRFCLSNHLNSSTLELDEQGGLLSREVYYAFGGTALWAGVSEIEGKYKTIRYSGKERDATGLYYYGYRYYAPWLQRWTNPDPEESVDRLHLFKFVSNNPVTLFDEEGCVGENVNKTSSDDARAELVSRLAQERESSPDQYSYIEKNFSHIVSKLKKNTVISEVTEGFYYTSEFVNRFKSHKWTIKEVFRRTPGTATFYTSQVVIHQYTLLSKARGFYGDVPTVIKQKNVLNEGVLAAYEKHRGDPVNLMNAFLNDTENGKLTQRLMKVLGVRPVSVRMEGLSKNINVYVEVVMKAAIQSADPSGDTWNTQESDVTGDLSESMRDTQLSSEPLFLVREGDVRGSKQPGL